MRKTQPLLRLKNFPLEGPGKGGMTNSPPDCALLCFYTKLIRLTKAMNKLRMRFMVFSILGFGAIGSILENDLRLVRCRWSPLPRRYPHVGPTHYPAQGASTENTCQCSRLMVKLGLHPGPHSRQCDKIDRLHNISVGSSEE